MIIRKKPKKEVGVIDETHIALDEYKLTGEEEEGIKRGLDRRTDEIIGDLPRKSHW